MLCTQVEAATVVVMVTTIVADFNLHYKRNENNIYMACYKAGQYFRFEMSKIESTLKAAVKNILIHMEKFNMFLIRDASPALEKMPILDKTHFLVDF